MDAPEGRDRRVDARSSFETKPLRSMLPPAAPYPSYPTPPIPSAAIFGDDLVGKLVARPILLDQGSDLRLHEGAHAFDQRALTVGKKRRGS